MIGMLVIGLFIGMVIGYFFCLSDATRAINAWKEACKTWENTYLEAKKIVIKQDELLERMLAELMK